MIETIATLVDGIFNFVIANTIPAAVVVLAVLALQYLFRKRFSPRSTRSRVSMTWQWLPESITQPCAAAR